VSTSSERNQGHYAHLLPTDIDRTMNRLFSPALYRELPTESKERE
jgi:hypothetical protein